MPSHNVVIDGLSEGSYWKLATSPCLWAITRVKTFGVNLRQVDGTSHMSVSFEVFFREFDYVGRHNHRIGPLKAREAAHTDK